MKKEEIVSGLASSYGREKAEEMLDSIIRGAGLPVKGEYRKAELLKLCDYMTAGSDRFLKTIGGFLKVRVILLKE